MHTPDTPSYGPAPVTTPPSRPPGSPPPVWTWFRVYAGVMAAMYIAITGLGLFTVALGPTIAKSSDNPVDAVVLPVMGAVYLVLGTVFTAVFVVGVLMSNRPWAWIYGIILISLGMSSPCCLPATIPLLVFWIKPETKAFFGRS